MTNRSRDTVNMWCNLQFVSLCIFLDAENKTFVLSSRTSLKNSINLNDYLKLNVLVNFYIWQKTYWSSNGSDSHIACCTWTINCIRQVAPICTQCYTRFLGHLDTTPQITPQPVQLLLHGLRTWPTHTCWLDYSTAFWTPNRQVGVWYVNITVMWLVYRKLPQSDSGRFWYMASIAGHINYSIYRN